MTKAYKINGFPFRTPQNRKEDSIRKLKSRLPSKGRQVKYFPLKSFFDPNILVDE
jgi:hypothetical protein